MKRALLVAALLAGCAGQAVKLAGGDPATYAQDDYQCSQESRVGIVHGANEPRVFFYGSNRLSQNEANRLYYACMGLRGWRKA